MAFVPCRVLLTRDATGVQYNVVHHVRTPNYFFFRTPYGISARSVSRTRTNLTDCIIVLPCYVINVHSLRKIHTAVILKHNTRAYRPPTRRIRTDRVCNAFFFVQQKAIAVLPVPRFVVSEHYTQRKNVTCRVCTRAARGTL